MSTNRWAPLISLILGFGLAGCGESETVNAINVRIVEMEDFTYTAGYRNGCRFTVQIVNNTEDQLEKLEAVVTEDGERLFSVTAELPPMGASQRTHDVQQNRRCREIGKTLDLRKSKCTMSTISEEECFGFLALVPDA